MINDESISTVPSSSTAEGAFTTGLMAWNCAKVLNTDTGSCVNSTPSWCSVIATRRTKGESSMPISRIVVLARGQRACGLAEQVHRGLCSRALRARSDEQDARRAGQRRTDLHDAPVGQSAGGKVIEQHGH